MSQSSDPQYRDLLTRIAQLEYRLTRIENTQQQLENTMTPGGYITESFERVYEDIDDLKNQMNARFDRLESELNGKIDIILRHITGQGNS